MAYPKLAGTTPTASSPTLSGSAAAVLRQFHTTVADFDPPHRAVDPESGEVDDASEKVADVLT